MYTIQGKFAGSLADRGGVTETQNGHPSMVKAFIEFRLKQLIPKYWLEIERAWKQAWIDYQKSRGVPRWYINTDSIPNAALVDSMSTLMRSIRVTASLGNRISVEGSIELNPQAVLNWHNQHRTVLSSNQQRQIRFNGANPRTMGVQGSFQTIRHSFLEEFLLAGPNKTAGKLTAVRGGAQRGRRSQTPYLNVFTNLGNTNIQTVRQGAAATGDRLMWYFAIALGFPGPIFRTGLSWKVASNLKGLKENTVMGTLMTVVMQEVRTKFPNVQFAE